jgi:hypothetical protein
MKFRGYRNKRSLNGALEGLPLYFLILVVVTGVVLGIVGVWLSAVKTDTIASIGLSYTTLTKSNAQFSQTSDGAYEFIANQALTVTVYGKGGTKLTGVIVTFTGIEGVYSVTPSSITTTTDSNTVTLTGYLAANTQNGIILVTANYNNGIITSQYQTQIMVEV